VAFTPLGLPCLEWSSVPLFLEQGIEKHGIGKWRLISEDLLPKVSAK
jgi:hypothetical protein